MQGRLRQRSGEMALSRASPETYKSNIGPTRLLGFFTCIIENKTPGQR